MRINPEGHMSRTWPVSEPGRIIKAKLEKKLKKTLGKVSSTLAWTVGRPSGHSQ